MVHTSKIERTYKKSAIYPDLKLHISFPENNRKDKAVIVFFHGAGFSTNKVTAAQFYHHAEHFAAKGFVTVCAEYRPLTVEGLFSPIESLKNAKSSIRWIREHAKTLGVNPNKLIAAGASAGGYLSLCCGTVEDFNDSSDNLAISSKPSAVVLFNGGVNSDVLISMFPELQKELPLASPVRYLKEGLPPCLFFHGTEDQNIPITDIINFHQAYLQKGNVSKLVTFEGMGHGFFNYGNYENKPYLKTLQEMESFLGCL